MVGGKENCEVFRHANVKKRGHLKGLGADGKSYHNLS
jgi:hypothetical protein